MELLINARKKIAMLQPVPTGQAKKARGKEVKSFIEGVVCLKMANQ